MSVSLQNTEWIETRFTINAHEREDKDCALVGKSLWESISSFPGPDHRFAISIAPRQPTRASRCSLPTLICWACLDEGVRSFTFPQIKVKFTFIFADDRHVHTIPLVEGV